VKLLVGRVGLEPRPADYEKYGPALRMRYLHGYHGVVPPMALVAPFARVTRSTNRSTSLLVGTSIGDWIGGLFGNFVAALLSIPVAGALQVIARELWQATAWAGIARQRTARRTGARGTRRGSTGDRPGAS
jgi:hypothetical protein